MLVLLLQTLLMTLDGIISDYPDGCISSAPLELVVIFFIIIVIIIIIEMLDKVPQKKNTVNALE